ncbi:type II toxin-antitoxin system Phd/YefM family antitoxin [Silvibacterium sp.]|uniref:type II toxin-antitoxin system Phd/YefM family antitoxin n=1 Tax=Silvibacterium sp. TaxID=1964179 RepID=UPI0039E68F42
MANATIFEAKTRLSELIRRAQAGETVTITSGREKKPVVRLVPVEHAEPVKKPQRLGLLYDPNFVLGDAFWEPLSDVEMGIAHDPFDEVIRAGLKDSESNRDSE